MGKGIVALMLYGLLGLQIGVVYSPQTPFDIFKVLSLCSSSLHTLTPTLVAVREDLTSIRQEVVVDYLYEESLSAWLREVVEPTQYFRLWGDLDGEKYGQQLSAYLLALNFTRVLLVTDTAGTNLATAQVLSQEYPVLYQEVATLPQDFSLSVALNFVGRHIKPRGFNLVVFLVSPLSALHLLQALQAKKLNKPGYAYILSQQASLYRYLPYNSSAGLLSSGVLIVAENHYIAATRVALEAKKLASLLTTDSGPTYQLYYTNNSQLLQAASTPADISTEMLFPGSTAAIPSRMKPTIRASVNYQVINPDLSLYPLAKPQMDGFRLAFEVANNSTDLLPDYTLQDYTVGFGGVNFSYNFSFSRVKAGLQDLGLIYMTSPQPALIMGMTQIFKDLNITMPVMAGSPASVLSDPHTFPLFVRPTISSVYQMLTMARVISHFGWQKVAVLYAKDQYSFEDCYEQFIKYTDSFGINVTNPSETRGLPAVLNNQTAAQVNASLAAILQSNTRVILFLHNYFFVGLEQLYDLGIREGYVILVITGLTDAVYADPQYYKRRVVSKGAIMFYPNVFVGQVGTRVKQQLLQLDGSSMVPNACLFYDAAFLYFYATQYLLESGQDYEDPLLIGSAMRGTHFYGCSGFFNIESGTNDRDATVMTLTNFQYHSNDTYSLKIIGAYAPLSTQPFQFYSPMQWPDDQPTYADTKPNYLDCPYLAEVVQDVSLAKTIGLCVHFGIAIATVPAAGLLVKKVWTDRPVALERVPISMEDVLAMAAVVVESLQVAALGPDLSAVSFVADALCEVVSVNVEELMSLVKGAYWTVVEVTLAVVGLWLLLCVLKARDLHLCCSLDQWTQMFMPAFGHLLFVPIVAILCGVFLCYKGVSDQLTDTFLNRDCNEFCWTGKHLGFAVGSAVALLVYVPVAVYTRHYWQDLQTNVHVKAVPWTVAVKSGVQMFLIAASNSLRTEPTVHAAVYFSILTLLLLFMGLFRQYNYDRLNMWQVLLTFALLSLSVAAYLSSYYPSLPLLLALLGEYILLGTVGIVMQTFIKRFEGKLQSDRRRDLRGLFRFAFTGGKKAAASLQEFYQVNGIRPNAVSVEDIALRREY